MSSLLTYVKQENGATAIEYGLIAAFVSLAIVASVFLFGDKVYTLLYSDLPKALGL